MIRKYLEEDFSQLSKWITSPQLLFQFAGPGWKYPLTKEQVQKHQEDFPHKQLYLGCDASGKPYAIGEIITNEPHSPRIGRLLIGNPLDRGKGLGGVFLQELIAETARLYDPLSICLFVLENNAPAIRCYQKLGFEFSEEPIPDMLLEDIPYRVYKMILKMKGP